MANQLTKIAIFSPRIYVFSIFRIYNSYTDLAPTRDQSSKHYLYQN